MIWHVADPDTFWDINKIPERLIERGWFYGDGRYMSLEEMYGQVYNFMETDKDIEIYGEKLLKLIEDAVKEF